MALPKIDVQTYELILPVSKKKVIFRPFLVKEEKILLMAQESSDKNTIVNTIKQILNNCTINEIDVNALPLVDIEFYFLNLRARSVGEVSELRYRCENSIVDNATKEEKMCNNTMRFDLNLLD